MRCTTACRWSSTIIEAGGRWCLGLRWDGADWERGVAIARHPGRGSRFWLRSVLRCGWPGAGRRARRASNWAAPTRAGPWQRNAHESAQRAAVPLAFEIIQGPGNAAGVRISWSHGLRPTERGIVSSCSCPKFGHLWLREMESSEFNTASQGCSNTWKLFIQVMTRHRQFCGSRSHEELGAPLQEPCRRSRTRDGSRAVAAPSGGRRPRGRGARAC